MRGLVYERGMPFEDVLAWSNQDVRMEISLLLPAGQNFRCYQDDDLLWRIEILHNEFGTVLWGTVAMDERLALFALYGHLWAKSQKRPPPEQPWGPRRQELIKKYVTQRVERPPDPEDLDPEEVASVYEEVLNPKKR